MSSRRPIPAGVAVALAFALAVAPSGGPLHALDFVFTPEPGTAQEAIDGFVAAGQLWSDLFDDDITVNIRIGFRSLDPGVLGSTSSQRTVVTYQQFVDALTADQTSADDTAAIGSLKPPTAFRMLLNRTSDSPQGSGSANPFLDADGDNNNTAVRLTRANAKALGLVAADDAALDASIAFSSDFNWDFEPADGTLANHFNFVQVAAHEIGHMLGFTSGVDILDTNSPPQGGPFSDIAFTWVNSKDLFRYSTTSAGQSSGVFDWTADTRAKFFSLDHGANDLGGFSTGRNFGDGRQASHWKDDRGLGIMDPTVAPGESTAISTLDTRLFDVIGWDLEAAAPAAQADLSISLNTVVDVTYVISATNAGPTGVTGASVDQSLPAGVSGVSWVCSSSGGASCTAAGSGDIHDTVDLPVGGRVTYTATGTAAGAGPTSATVGAPSGVQDPAPGNNSASGG
jgi:uncharacterized repeat protein (TIGR01451 family)